MNNTCVCKKVFSNTAFHLLLGAISMAYTLPTGIWLQAFYVQYLIILYEFDKALCFGGCRSF